MIGNLIGVVASRHRENSNYFTTKWDATSGFFYLPVVASESYNFEYRVNEGSWVVYNQVALSNNEILLNGLSGIVTVDILITSIPRWGTRNDQSNSFKLLSVESWSAYKWPNLQDAFYDCANLSLNNTDILDLSQCTSLSSTFHSCISISSWDNSKVIYNVSPINTNSTFQNMNNLASINVTGLKSNSAVAMFRDSVMTSIVCPDLLTASTISLKRWSRNGASKNLTIVFSNWDITSINNWEDFATNCNITNYNDLLIYIANGSPLSNQNFDGGSSTYTIGSAGETARNILVNTYNWTITDGGGI